MDAARKAEAGTKRESKRRHTYTVCNTDHLSGKLPYSREPSSGLCDDLPDRREEAPDGGGYMYTES